ncbi:MAG: AbgT family transporter, partial [Planctomycetota bacterium]|nr:AbgT family transporter [Planctomycetota bacterium]
MTNNINANGINSPRSTLSVFLDVVERVGNRLPDPVTIFVGLAVAAPGLSWLVSLLGVSVVHPETGETITAVNLLSRDGIQKILGNMVENFTGFKPLGTVLVAMIGVGIAERTGLFAAMLKWLV